MQYLLWKTYQNKNAVYFFVLKLLYNKQQQQNYYINTCQASHCEKRHNLLNQCSHTANQQPKTTKFFELLFKTQSCIFDLTKS